MSKLVRNLSSGYLSVSQAFSRENRQGRTVYAYVEGYEDIAFWRGVFSAYETESLRFEINTPSRDDLAKGKKVLLAMAENCGDSMVLCVDSDFDYLFGDHTAQSRQVNRSPFIFQTYVYSVENYLCYPPSLREACVRATNNDTYLFDFEYFMREYSRAIYSVFLWYVYSALQKKENFFTLNDFRNTVKLNYLQLENNGEETIAWLRRVVSRKLQKLEQHYPHWVNKVLEFGNGLKHKGVTADNVYLYMHGHTLFDHVVLIAVNTVCETLKMQMLELIRRSNKTGTALNNEYSNYKNSLRDIASILKDNGQYRKVELFRKLESDIEAFIRRQEKKNGE